MSLAIEKRWLLNKQTGIKEFFLSSEQFDDDIKFIKSNKIKNIVIYNINVLSNLELETLSNINFLESLHIGIPLGNLEKLKCENLLNLTVGEGNYGLEFKHYNKLENLFIEYNTGVTFHNRLFHLKRLVFRNCRNKIFNWQKNFSTLLSLEKLELTDCYLPPELGFLNSCNQLKELEIYLNPKPFRLQALQENTKLERLILSQCPHLQHKEDIPLLQSVKWLRLTDCGSIEDCSLFYNMPNLEVLIVTGKSYFVNGDLSGMMGRLKHFGFEKKRHYSHKPDDFSSIFRKE